jgi:lipopolysaccharide/colanic/teichoic acid biosynthesis glycosyltransferase
MRRLYVNIKMVIDFFIALVLLPILMLVLIPSAICIKLEDGGPVFYMGERLGRRGKVFKMYKLRTMKVNAPDIRLEDGSTYNAEDDPRVTRFGRFARKTSIDELPQILNILKGEMAFVGPRPDLPDDIKTYSKKERKILLVRPGITGYNQAVNRNSVTAHEKLKNDVYYVEHMSFAFDIKIILMTIKTVLSHKNVYRK